MPTTSLYILQGHSSSTTERDQIAYYIHYAIQFATSLVNSIHSMPTTSPYILQGHSSSTTECDQIAYYIHHAIQLATSLVNSVVHSLGFMHTVKCSLPHKTLK